MKMIVPSARTLRKMGLDVFQFSKLWAHQQGRCAICRRTFTGNRRPCIDHDHFTYEVRGLLCSYCNYEIGCLHDDSGWLQRAADYLNDTPASNLWQQVPLVSGAPVRKNG